jgi:hypothetical protein
MFNAIGSSRRASRLPCASPAIDRAYAASGAGNALATERPPLTGTAAGARRCPGRRAQRRPFTGTHRSDQSDARPADPPRDVGKHRRACPVQPVHIIDHCQHRLGGNDDGQEPQRRDRDGPLLRRGPIHQTEGHARRSLTELIQLDQLAERRPQQLAQPPKLKAASNSAPAARSTRTPSRLASPRPRSATPTCQLRAHPSPTQHPRPQPPPPKLRRNETSRSRPTRRWDKRGTTESSGRTLLPSRRPRSNPDPLTRRRQVGPTEQRQPNEDLGGRDGVGRCWAASSVSRTSPGTRARVRWRSRITVRHLADATRRRRSSEGPPPASHHQTYLVRGRTGGEWDVVRPDPAIGLAPQGRAGQANRSARRSAPVAHPSDPARGAARLNRCRRPWALRPSVGPSHSCFSPQMSACGLLL